MRITPLMFRIFILVFLYLAVLSVAVSAEDRTVHLVKPGSWVQQPVTPETVNRRIERAAAEYVSYGSVPRIAFHDIAYPADDKEYAALDGFGVMLVTVFSQDRDEIPPKRIFARVDNAEVTLYLFTSVFTKNSGSTSVKKVLGPNRWDGLYYYPVYLTLQAEELVMDFARNRSGLVMAQFTDANRAGLDYLKTPIQRPKEDKPSIEALTKLVAREYPGFVTNEKAP
jgi:hypothetical protein